MKPIDAALAASATSVTPTDSATRQLSSVRAKLLQETSQQFAHKDVFPPNPPTPTQLAVARADHGAPVPAAAPPAARPQKVSRHSVDTRA